MTDDTPTTDALLSRLAALRGPEPDARRADRTRDRCHQRLARRRRPGIAARFRPWRGAAEAALLAALVLVFLGAAVHRTAILLRW